METRAQVPALVARVVREVTAALLNVESVGEHGTEFRESSLILGALSGWDVKVRCGRGPLRRRRHGNLVVGAVLLLRRLWGCRLLLAFHLQRATVVIQPVAGVFAI